MVLETISRNHSGKPPVGVLVTARRDDSANTKVPPRSPTRSHERAYVPSFMPPLPSPGIHKEIGADGDVVMPDGCAGHRVDGSSKAFMLRVADFLACEVIIWGNEIRRSDSEHGGKLAGWRVLAISGWRLAGQGGSVAAVSNRHAIFVSQAGGWKLPSANQNALRVVVESLPLLLVCRHVHPRIWAST